MVVQFHDVFGEKPEPHLGIRLEHEILADCIIQTIRLVDIRHNMLLSQGQIAN